MRPINFPQMNGSLNRPPTMTEVECLPLPVHASPNHDAFISCWRPSWRERFALLFGAPLWVWVLGARHPPLALETEDPFKR